MSNSTKAVSTVAKDSVKGLNFPPVDISSIESDPISLVIVKDTPLDLNKRAKNLLPIPARKSSDSVV